MITDFIDFDHTFVIYIVTYCFHEFENVPNIISYGKQISNNPKVIPKNGHIYNTDIRVYKITINYIDKGNFNTDP